MELQSGQAELQSAVTELQSAVTELQSAVTELQSGVVELQSNFSENKAVPAVNGVLYHAREVRLAPFGRYEPRDKQWFQMDEWCHTSHQEKQWLAVKFSNFKP